MTKNTTNSGNPFLDNWFKQQQSFLELQEGFQKKWLSMGNELGNTVEKTEFSEQLKSNWKACEEQFSSWVNVSENWFSQKNQSAENNTPDVLKMMLDPKNFMFSSMNDVHQYVKKMVNIPDFADAGIIEKMMIKSGDEWLEMQKASNEYQAMISETWSVTFQHYIEEFNALIKSGDVEINAKTLLDKWLKLANDEMIKVQRSERFLDIQNKLVNASSQLKLSQREIMETWCEANDIPTRTEIDDVHQQVYSLKKELRLLKRQFKETKPV